MKIGRKTGLNASIWQRRLAGTALFALCSAGCGGRSQLAGDPLVGGGPALVASANPSAAPRPAASLPPLPAPAATASNAALAAGPGRPIDGRHDLQINEPRAALINPNWSPPGTTGNASVTATEPAPTAADRGSTPAYTATGGSRLGSFEQARAQLEARGISWFRLESSEQGAYKFSCSVPHRQNPVMSRTYEAQASSELAAIQAVLDQIDRERQ